MEKKKKKHNWVTGPKNVPIDAAVTIATRRALDSVNHLTPMTDAIVDNMLDPDGKPVSEEAIEVIRLETIEKNTPGYFAEEILDVSPGFLDEENVEPTKAQLKREETVC